MYPDAECLLLSVVGGGHRLGSPAEDGVEPNAIVVADGSHLVRLADFKPGGVFARAIVHWIPIHFVPFWFGL